MLRALVDLRYNSRQISAGEEFEPVSESDAHVLQMAGKVEKVDEDKTQTGGLFGKPDQRKRRAPRYRRSDMRAED